LEVQGFRSVYLFFESPKEEEDGHYTTFRCEKEDERFIIPRFPELILCLIRDACKDGDTEIKKVNVIATTCEFHWEVR
jgi:hypothetical protein